MKVIYRDFASCLLIILLVLLATIMQVSAEEMNVEEFMATAYHTEDDPLWTKALDPYEVVLIPGETAQMRYLGAMPENEGLFFESSDTDVATVDAQGMVTGIGEGTAYIATRSANSYYAAGYVRVLKSTEGLLNISIKSTSKDVPVTTTHLMPVFVMDKGTVIDLKKFANNEQYILKPKGEMIGDIASNYANWASGWPQKGVKCESEDKLIVSVDKNGKLTAKGYGYTFVRIASDDKEPMECFVRVVKDAYTYVTDDLETNIKKRVYQSTPMTEYFTKDDYEWDPEKMTLGMGGVFYGKMYPDQPIPNDTEEFFVSIFARVYDKNGQLLGRYNASTPCALCNMLQSMCLGGGVNFWMQFWPLIPDHIVVSIEPHTGIWRSWDDNSETKYLPGAQPSFTIQVVSPKYPHFLVDIPNDTMHAPGDTIDFTFYSISPELVTEPMQCRIADSSGKVDVNGEWFDSQTESVTIPVTFTEDMIEFYEEDSEGMDSVMGGVYPLYYVGVDTLPVWVGYGDLMFEKPKVE